MGKYDKLQDYLEVQDADVVEMTIVDIELILGFSLPTYAGRQQFWQNETDYEAPSSHPQSRAWQQAGFKVEHRIGEDTVRFVRQSS